MDFIVSTALKQTVIIEIFKFTLISEGSDLWPPTVLVLIHLLHDHTLFL